MNKQIQSLFDAIYEANGELYEEYKTSVVIEGELVYAKTGTRYKEITIQHLLITAEARGKYIFIGTDGNVYRGENEVDCNVVACRVDLPKSVSEQSESTLLKIAEIIL